MPNSGQPGLYVHVPFCSAICPYCDFAVSRGDGAARRRFAEGVTREAGLWSPESSEGWTAGAFDTIYLGGGTPSLLEPALLEGLLGTLREVLPVDPDAWLSLEANPEDVTAERLAFFRRLGVRTLSLGVQSFDRSALKFLGRRHTPEQAAEAVKLSLAEGFHTVSVDLIFGLPADREAPGALERSLDRLVELRPQHVSCYQLTFHEGTPFGRGLARGVIRPLPEPAQAEAYELVCRRLAAVGYRAYEVSNWALATPDGEDHRSRHNRKYWHHVPYLGLGPGAHSFVPGNSLRRTGQRWWNERSVEVWEERLAAGERPVAGVEELGPEAMALETVMLGLRTAEGIDLEDFEQRFGFDLVERNRTLVDRLVGEGLLELGGGRLRPTVRGFAVADGLPAGFEVGGG